MSFGITSFYFFVFLAVFPLASILCFAKSISMDMAANQQLYFSFT